MIDVGLARTFFCTVKHGIPIIPIPVLSNVYCETWHSYHSYPCTVKHGIPIIPIPVLWNMAFLSLYCETWHSYHSYPCTVKHGIPIIPIPVLWNMAFLSFLSLYCETWHSYPCTVKHGIPIIPIPVLSNVYSNHCPLINILFFSQQQFDLNISFPSLLVSSWARGLIYIINSITYAPRLIFSTQNRDFIRMS